MTSLEESESCLKEGDELTEKGEYSAAIKLFTKALQLPSLPELHLCSILEKRASLLFKLSLTCSRTLNIYETVGFQDAIKITQLNPDSWKGQRILGHLLRRRGDFQEKAEECIRRSIKFSPSHEDLRGFDKFLMTRPSGKESRRVDAMSDDDFEFLPTNTKPNGLPGSDLVNKAHGYRSQSQDIKENSHYAFCYYEKAAQLGNAQGIYFMSQFYLTGAGVPQDIQKGIELLNKAGNMPPKPVNDDGEIVDDIGVQLAQHALGVKYEEGQFLPQDYKLAASWFKKSADNGFGPAANNLAFLYSKGLGVKKSEKMSEMYWKSATWRGSMYAAFMLYNYYLEHVEPEAAELHYKIALRLGLKELELLEGDMETEVSQKIDIRMEHESKLLDFENIYKLDKKGLTFHERMLRAKELNSKPQELLLLKMKGMSMDGNSTGEDTHSKLYLKDPTRIAYIKKHRGMQKLLLDSELASDAEELSQPIPDKNADFKSINLFEMDQTKEGIYEGRILHLTIIEDPLVLPTMWEVLAEDDHGDVILVQLFKIGEKTEENLNKWGFGSAFSIINPYVIADPNDGFDVLRVSDIKFIRGMAKKNKMCRFCGRQNAQHKCSKCKIDYCTRECQKMDWKVLGHKVICLDKKN